MSMIVEFASEVVNNWVIVAQQLRMEAYRVDMAEALATAIAAAAAAARWFGIEPLFAIPDKFNAAI